MRVFLNHKGIASVSKISFLLPTSLSSSFTNNLWKSNQDFGISEFINVEFAETLFNQNGISKGIVKQALAHLSVESIPDLIRFSSAEI